MTYIKLFILLCLVSCASKEVSVRIIPSPSMIEKNKCLEVIEEYYQKGYWDGQTHRL